MFSVNTEVMTQDDAVTFDLNETTPHFQRLPMS